jgi:hypothetical protein
MFGAEAWTSDIPRCSLQILSTLVFMTLTFDRFRLGSKDRQGAARRMAAVANQSSCHRLHDCSQTMIRDTHNVKSFVCL